MDVLRTPDERFDELDGFAYTPHYTDIAAGDGWGKLRIHHIDEGPRNDEAVLLMHGEPSWSYLYRSMIGSLVGAGYRVLAPDLVGFGRSDKPASPSDYTYQRHVDWMDAWFTAVDVDRPVTLFAQDWGGLIGLRLVAKHPDRFARVCVANTGFPTGDQNLGEAFVKWREYSQNSPTFPVSSIIQNSTVRILTDAELAAYDAPFPDDSYKAGARVFPSLVPASPDDPAAPAQRAAWQVLSQFHRPFVTAFSDSDPVTRGGERPFQKLIPGAHHDRHVTINNAGHHLQEDKPAELASLIITLIEHEP